MKRWIQAISVILIVFAVLALASCGKTPTVHADITYDKNGVYTGFSDIPENYDATKAAEDGCLTIDILREPNAGGEPVSKEIETFGYEKWEAFLAAAENGEDAFLRVAQFIDGTGYYHDLYYHDGAYTIFDLNEYGISEGQTFRYLRRLEGMTGPASDPKEDFLYVLTDSKRLAYHDVTWSYLSSDSRTVTTIPFEWLGFMIYFK